MTILRADKSERTYKRVCMDFATDPRLSWEARGVMAYLLSKSDDWRIIVEDIIKRGNAGRDKVYRILDELQAAGYLIRTRIRDAHGRVQRVDYSLTEVSLLPENTEVVPLPDLPEVENTEVVNSLLPDLPYPAKPTLPKEERVPTVDSLSFRESAPATIEPPASRPEHPNPPVAPAPLPREVEQPRLVDAEMPDPVTVYREVAGVKKPNQAQREAIRRRVTGYPEQWREVCDRFARNGWRPQVIDNLLDAYDKAVAERRKVEAREREAARVAAEARERRQVEVQADDAEARERRLAIVRSFRAWKEPTTSTTAA